MDGLALPARLIASQKITKAGLPDAHLETIFKGLAEFKESADPTRIEWFWRVLMLAFTGARAGEIVQLHRADVRLQEGLWCVQIEPGQGRTSKSKTRCPSAPFLSMRN